LESPPHRRDEFPTGYSSAGCPPAEPASASPAGDILKVEGVICQMRPDAPIEKARVCGNSDNGEIGTDPPILRRRPKHAGGRSSRHEPRRFA